MGFSSIRFDLLSEWTPRGAVRFALFAAAATCGIAGHLFGSVFSRTVMRLAAAFRRPDRQKAGFVQQIAGMEQPGGIEYEHAVVDHDSRQPGTNADRARL